MQPSSATAIETDPPARRHRAIEPIDGYIHKFRLEAGEAAASPELAPTAEPTTTVVELVAKFALAALALSGLLFAGARALGN